MSDSQTAWTILWNRALRSAEPFETSEVIPEVAGTLRVEEKDASRLVGLLLGELSRLPEGRRFFRLEGRAVVSLPEFRAAVEAGSTPLAAYPFEL